MKGWKLGLLGIVVSCSLVCLFLGGRGLGLGWLGLSSGQDADSQGWLTGPEPETAADEEKPPARDSRGLAIESRLRELEKKVDANPQDARALNDLGVLRMRTSETQPFRLIQALGDLRRAREANPRLLPARYNLALALESFSLRGLALHEWRDFVRLAPLGSARRRLAERHRLALSESRGVERWQRDLPQVQEAALHGDAAKVRGLVNINRELARVEVEEILLPGWSLATLQGDGPRASRQLRIAIAIGDALYSLQGDRWVLDLTQEVVALTLNRDRSRALAVEIQNFDSALRVQREGAFLEGANRFQAFQHAIQEKGETWALLGASRRSICLFRARLYAQSLPLQNDLIATFLNRGYRSQAAILLRNQGGARLFQGEPEKALEAYQRSLAIFRQLEEPGNVVSTAAKVADTLKALGRQEEAWPYLVQALRTVGQQSDLLPMRASFGEAARAISETDPATALLFMDEFSRLAEERGNPDDRSLALRDRATLLFKLERTEESLAAIQAARVQAERISSEDTRQVAVSETLAAQAEILAAAEPHAAVAPLTGLLRELEKKPYRWQESRVVLLRAWCYERLQKLAKAENDLLLAVALQDDSRVTIRQPWNRLAFLDRGIRAYDELARFRLEHGRGAAPALEAVERSRGRLILDWTLLLPSAGRPTWRTAPLEDLESLRARIPDGGAVLEYRLLGGKLAVWKIDRHGIVARFLTPNLRNLAARVAQLRWLLEKRSRAASDQLRTVAASLYRDLLGPLLVGDRGAGVLAIIPDGPLWDLPWSALVVPENGHYLIEDREILLSPSLSVAARKGGGGEEAQLRALLVGSDAPDVRGHPGLRPLTQVPGEIAALSDLYRDATVLTGRSATRAAFLAALPTAGMVHFAGHVVDAEESPLRSALLFARNAETGEPGALQAAKLLGGASGQTRLVVLAACSTALGRESRSEGRLNLALPFLVRGVRQAVVTQWNVSDGVARAFSLRFHSNLRKGLSPVEALTEAKVRLSRCRNSELNRPEAWAAFDLIGSF